MPKGRIRQNVSFKRKSYQYYTEIHDLVSVSAVRGEPSTGSGDHKIKKNKYSDPSIITGTETDCERWLIHLRHIEWSRTA